MVAGEGRLQEVAEWMWEVVSHEVAVVKLHLEYSYNEMVNTRCSKGVTHTYPQSLGIYHASNMNLGICTCSRQYHLVILPTA